ncbi:Metallothionein-like protein 4B [Datura stramonium]|uniref:Metallothionein-like protein 4B n=1 Tax=Datura stramonium TaxID=4076 RepID=A0ABS8SZ71_DATST|nr:Metallothionein-like protein 4B [Datura stramonium]
MADVRGSSASCNERCGCPSPCPGGTVCRCSSGDDANMEHKRCSCGEHCGCNPCGCPQSEGATAATGKANCKCGPGCTCTTCAA